MTKESSKPVLLAFIAILAISLLCHAAAAQGDQSWRGALEETCAKSNDAMALSVKELNDLLEKCAALEKVIQGEEESVRKVYLKRLSLCKNLYLYVLDYKKNGGSAATPAP